MNRLKRLIHDIHSRSLWQVLLVYLGVSWAVLEAADLFTERLGLAAWLFWVAVGLLISGLVFVLILAFLPEPAVSPTEPPGFDLAGAGRRQLLIWRRAATILVVALAAWGVVAAGWLLLSPSGVGVEEAFADAAPGIAVLPFSVHGEDLDVWREGMVDLLSTGLDGAGFLRAIDSRTVLARWRERVPETGVADQATALRVAQATGARYALLGSAVAIGPQVRLVADVYEAESGNQMGQAQVEGSPESVLMLVDRLAVEALLIILEQRESELPRINIASVTTASIPALKAWLEGEALHRRADFDAAIAAYERAVEADSTFALAYYQLSIAYGWSEGMFSERETEALQYAGRWVDKLPAREDVLVRAALALDRNSLDGLEPLQQLVRKYPDDAHAWWMLGEIYYHWGERIPVGWEESDRAFARAVELDPGFAPYQLHLINIAFKYKPDSARVAELIEQYERLAPSSRSSREARIAFHLAFGDPQRSERALAGLDTLDLDILASLPMEYLLHPRFWPQFAAVMLTLNRRGSEEGRGFRTWFLFWGTAGGRGYLRKALEYLDDPKASAAERACFPQAAYTTGLPVPNERLEEMAALASQIDSTSPPWWVGCVGTYAADRGRWADHAGAIESLNERTRHALSLGDSAQAQEAKAQAQRLEGYGLWRRGNLEAAVRILEDIPRDEADDEMRWWLGQLYLEQERWRDAVPYLRSYWWTPMAHAYYYLGQAYERLEEYAEARKAYAYFVSAWQDADPEFQPRVEAARRAIEALSPDT
jgi:tetratricopeptide (TPR) repeat protein